MRRETLGGRRGALRGWRAFSFWVERENYGEERKGEAFDRKSPPIAKARKVGHPQDHLLGGVGETQERSQ